MGPHGPFKLKIGRMEGLGMYITKMKVRSDNEWVGQGRPHDVIEIFKIFRSSWKLVRRQISVCILRRYRFPVAARGWGDEGVAKASSKFLKSPITPKIGTETKIGT